MRDQKPRRPHPPLTLRKQRLRVLAAVELDQVVGGIGQAARPKGGFVNGRDVSRNCLGG